MSSRQGTSSMIARAARIARRAPPFLAVVAAVACSDSTLAPTAASTSDRASETFGQVILTRTVGPAGRTLCAIADDVIVVIPRRALSRPVKITLLEGVAAPGDPTLVPRSAREIAPSTLTFARPIEVALLYDSTTVPAGTWPVSIHLVRLVDGAWRPVGGSGRNLDSPIAYGVVTSAGTYAAAGYPEDDFEWPFGVTVSGQPSGHLIGEYEDDVRNSLTITRSLEQARSFTEEEVQFARGLWASGELGDLAAARDAVLRFIRSRLHRVGLPAPETLEMPADSD